VAHIGQREVDRPHAAEDEHVSAAGDGAVIVTRLGPLRDVVACFAGTASRIAGTVREGYSGRAQYSRGTLGEHSTRGVLRASTVLEGYSGTRGVPWACTPHAAVNHLFRRVENSQESPSGWQRGPSPPNTTRYSSASICALPPRQSIEHRKRSAVAISAAAWRRRQSRVGLTRADHRVQPARTHLRIGGQRRPLKSIV
jgi:hypothetical protein